MVFLCITPQKFLGKMLADKVPLIMDRESHVDYKPPEVASMSKMKKNSRPPDVKHFFLRK